MTDESIELPAALLAWLTREHDEAPPTWEPEPPLDELACHPDLIERLATLARGLPDVRRTFVHGCPVIHHPGGVPIATATGTKVLVVRSHDAPGVLRSRWHTVGLGAEWCDLDPWAPDVTFSRSTDLLRDALRRSYGRAVDTP